MSIRDLERAAFIAGYMQAADDIEPLDVMGLDLHSAERAWLNFIGVPREHPALDIELAADRPPG